MLREARSAFLLKNLGKVMKTIVCALYAAAAALALSASPAVANGGECFDKGTGTYGPCPGFVNWSGLYGGAHIGYGSSEIDATFAAVVPINSVSTFDLDGLVGGIQFGAQHHFSNNIVLGIEADVSKMSWEDSDSITFPPTINEDAEIETLASLRLRAGYAVGEFMPYVTGGVAAAAWQYDYDVPGVFPAAQDLSETAIGGVVGGGLEWMVLEDVSLGAEGLYYFIDESEALVSPAPLPSAAGDSVDIDDIFVGRVRVNFLF